MPIDRPALHELIRTLTKDESLALRQVDDQPWWECGRAMTLEIDERTYWYWLELLPPRWMDGDCFCFGEGDGPFRLFWQRQHRFYGREMTVEETLAFARAANVALHL